MSKEERGNGNNSDIRERMIEYVKVIDPVTLIYYEPMFRQHFKESKGDDFFRKDDE